MKPINETTLREIFSQNLLNEMKKRSLTQKELANLLTVTPAQISLWMRGLQSPEFRSMALICSTLKISPEKLLSKSA